MPVRPSTDRKRRIPRKPDARGKRVKTENGAKSPPPVREDRVEEEDQVERDEAGWRKKEPKEDPYQQYDDEEEEPAKPEKPKTEFQKALEANKAMRRPRRKDADPAKVESECVLFLEKMMKVRDDDIKAYRSGKPALNKLMMIRDVELMCMKVSHREQLMDNMLLAIIKAWLDPMPDGALPNVDIRTSLLTILSDMKVDADWVERLESSQGLGRVIHFLSCKDPHEPNKRLASKLMMRWARPVYQSNANYHDLLNEFDKPDEGHRAPKEGLASDRKAAMHSLKHIKASEERRNSFKTTPTGKDKKQILAAVPRPAPMLYTRLVESDTTLDPKTIRESRNNKARTRKVNRTMFNLRRLNKRNSARAAKPSVNGR